MQLDGAKFLPRDAYEREGICIALVGNRKVSIKWALKAMSVKFPPNWTRAVLCYPHPNLDVSRNIAIREWLLAPNDIRTDWIVLLSAESPIRWDIAINCCAISKDKISKIGESYVIHRDCFGDPPWFVNDMWAGKETPVERKDLEEDLEAQWKPGTTEVAALDAGKMVAICIPTLGYTSMLWASHAIQMGAPMASTGTTVVAEGHEVGEARERLMQAVLDMNPRPKYALFYGDDNLPRYDGLQLLFETMHKTGAGAVAGLYYMKNSPPDVPILWKNDQAGPLLPGVDFNVGDVIQVDGTGLDFVLFRTEALEKISRPRFRTVTDWVPGRGMMIQTEDAFFWAKWLSVYGKGPLVDTRCRVGHYNHVSGVVYGV